MQQEVDGLAGDRANRLGVRTWPVVDSFLAIVGLWLAGTAPISFGGGTYDDLFYIRIATSVANGHWLGPFGQLTLARGPIFPIFLACAALCRIPLNLACQVVILAGSFLLARFAGRAIGRRSASTAIFALLALNPVPWSLSLALVMREKLYVGETLLTLGVAAHCLPLVQRSAKAGWSSFGWAFTTGLVFAVLWLTREEGVWMIPALATVLLLRTGTRLWPHLSHRKRPKSGWIACEALVWVLPVLGFCTVVLPLAAINDAEYGVFRTNDFQTGPFPAAYGAMLRVEPAHWHQYGFLPRDVRLALYRESPAARELQPALEGQVGQDWIRVGCNSSPIPACDDLQGGWAMFAIRAAVDAAGHYRSAADADRFYDRLAHEINESCSLGHLRCTGQRRGMLPPFRRAYVWLTLRSFWTAAVQTVLLSYVQPGPLLISPSLFDLAESTPIALGPEAPTLAQVGAPTFLLLGWLASMSGSPVEQLSVTLADGQDGALTTEVAPDIPSGAGRPNSHAVRYEARCTPDCRLHVFQGVTTLFDKPVSALRPGITKLGPDVLLNIDIARRMAPPPLLADVPSRVASTEARVLQSIGRVIIPLSVLATPAILLAGLRRRQLQCADMLAGVLLIALLSRLALLAVGDATTVPALEFRFLAPGMAIGLALGGVVSASILVRSLGRTSRTDT